MKTIPTLVLLAIWSLGLLFGFSGPVDTGTIRFEVTGLRSSNGKFMIELFNQSEGYPSDPSKAMRLLTLPIVNKVCVDSFTNLPYGAYAISGFHDENGDGVLNSNWLKIPKEGVCASNNAKGHFGPPSFKDARFQLSAPTLSLKLMMSY
jgi:uncharacterized protein (DUF2141 family)